MGEATVEFTVEPFTEGSPGEHVRAAIAAVRRTGLEPEVGAFATTATGPVHQVVEAVRELLAAGLARGATRISVQVEAEPDVEAGR